MTTPHSPADFFALEAGECLNRLERELGQPDTLRPDQFVQQARQLRGAAVLANQPAIGRAAAALESLARAVREGRQPWDHRTRELSLQSVDDFRSLVRATAAWDASADERAARLTTALEQVGGISATPHKPTQQPDAGVRAFIAREGALVASALDRAARALRTSSDAKDALQAVLRRMQPLRGLAGLSELAPLPDVLEGVELAVARPAAPGLDDIVDAAAQALTRVCRDVAEGGLPVADSPEAQRFTELLLRTLAAEAAPSASTGATLGSVELVSHGEHLSHVADELDGARSRTERDLRLLTLLASLRVLSTGQVSEHGGLGGFASAAREAIAAGHASAAPAAFAVALRQAGALLRGTADARDGDAVVTAWRRCAESLASGVLAPEMAAVPGDVEIESAGSGLVASLSSYHQLFVTRWSEEPSLDGLLGALSRSEGGERGADSGDGGDRGETTLASEDDVVSIESLAPAMVTATEAAVAPIAPIAPVEADIIPIEALAPTGSEGGDRGEWGDGVSVDDDVVPIETLAPDAVVAELPIAPFETEIPLAPLAPIAPVAPIEDIVVPVTTLLYRGRSALERAAALRRDLSAQIDASADWTTVRPLVEELLDLVPLALDDA